MTRVGGGDPRLPDFSEFHLNGSPEVILLNDDGITFSLITKLELKVQKNFTAIGGILTTINGGIYLLNTSVHLETNKAMMLTLGLFINGMVQSDETIDHDFSNQSKVEAIPDASIITLAPGDEVEYRVRGDGTLAVTITIRKMDITFLEIIT